MDIRSRLSAIETERALFAVSAIVTGVLTVLVFRSGYEDQGPSLPPSPSISAAPQLPLSETT
ncbi:hypothetical protein ACFQER_00255 [Halomicroarcula sp. GCM10025894]|uniref:hypothetical protein n=1 Tax=Halomicroarcula sp. GCM10025894 TaxID=3252673 RepID=UPI003616FA12